jgi:DNA invertase Pin-like site-specific DNA recombinase
MTMHGYVRHSSPNRRARDIAALRAAGCERVYWDAGSSLQIGPGWREMVNAVEAGDTVRVVQWSALTRQLSRLGAIVEQLRALGVAVGDLDGYRPVVRFSPRS